jgi:acetyl-CoA C-acetyltransferase
MRATEIACHNLMLGKTDISLVVGCESMSNVPYLVQKGRSGYRLGDGKFEDAMLADGLVCRLAQGHMGNYC